MRIWISWHRLLMCPGVRIYQVNCAIHFYLGAYMDHGDACDAGRVHRYEHHTSTIHKLPADRPIPTASDVATRSMRRLRESADARRVPRPGSARIRGVPQASARKV